MAEPKASNPSLTKHERAQLRLQPAKDAVLDYLDEDSLLKARVREVALDLDRMGVIVYLAHGPLNEAANAAFSEITASTKTPIIIVPALFSAEEIEAAEDAIIKSQAGVATVRNEGDTLVVGIKGGELSRRPSAIRSGGINIPVRYEQSDMEELATRQNDSNPWTAGARVKVGSQGCSSGFGVRNGESGDFMLTAGHCYGNGVTVLDGAGNTMGTTSARNLSIDSILIKVPKASGYMYDGTWNTTSGAREKVVGTHRSVINDGVCTSGSFAGTRCGIVVRSTNAKWVVGSTSVTGILASPSNSRSIAAGKGDSGGPVLVNTGTSREIRAAGLISVGDSTVPCTGQGTSTCYNDLYFVPIQNAQRGLLVVTG